MKNKYVFCIGFTVFLILLKALVTIISTAKKAEFETVKKLQDVAAAVNDDVADDLKKKAVLVDISESIFSKQCEFFHIGNSESGGKKSYALEIKDRMHRTSNIVYFPEERKIEIEKKIYTIDAENPKKNLVNEIISSLRAPPAGADQPAPDGKKILDFINGFEIFGGAVIKFTVLVNSEKCKSNKIYSMLNNYGIILIPPPVEEEVQKNELILDFLIDYRDNELYGIDVFARRAKREILEAYIKLESKEEDIVLISLEHVGKLKIHWKKPNDDGKSIDTTQSEFEFVVKNWV